MDIKYLFWIDKITLNTYESINKPNDNCIEIETVELLREIVNERDKTKNIDRVKELAGI
jgi:hypothetical protein